LSGLCTSKDVHQLTLTASLVPMAIYSLIIVVAFCSCEASNSSQQEEGLSGGQREYNMHWVSNSFISRLCTYLQSWLIVCREFLWLKYISHCWAVATQKPL